MRALLFLPVLALAACGSDADTAATPDAAAPAESIADDAGACQVLTPDMVATALSLPAASLTLDEERMATAVQYGVADEGDYCDYDISDDDRFDRASVTLSRYDDAGAAEAFFASQYRARTDEETEQIRSAGDQAAEDMVADGRVDAETVEGMDVGGMLSGLASKFEYQDLPGVGDRAVVEVNRIMDPAMPTTVHMRRGAVISAVSVEAEYAFSQDEANFDAMREAQVALAREVVSAR